MGNTTEIAKLKELRVLLKQKEELESKVKHLEGAVNDARAELKEIINNTKGVYDFYYDKELESVKAEIKGIINSRAIAVSVVSVIVLIILLIVSMTYVSQNTEAVDAVLQKLSEDQNTNIFTFDHICTYVLAMIIDLSVMWTVAASSSYEEEINKAGKEL